MAGSSWRPPGSRPSRAGAAGRPPEAGARAGSRPRRSWRPPRARPSRSRPWQGVAVPETAGYERGGGSVTGEGRGPHRRPTPSPGRDAVVTSCESRGRDAGNVNVQRGRPRFHASSSCVGDTRSSFGPSSGPKDDRAPRGSGSGPVPCPETAGTVTFPASSSRLRRRPVTDPLSRADPAVSLGQNVTEVRSTFATYSAAKVDRAFRRSRKADFVSAFCLTLDFVPSLRRLPHEDSVPVPSPQRTPHVPGVSWRPHPAGVATRRPGRTSDGRGAPKHAANRTAGAAAKHAATRMARRPEARRNSNGRCSPEARSNSDAAPPRSMPTSPAAPAPNHAPRQPVAPEARRRPNPTPAWPGPPTASRPRRSRLPRPGRSGGAASGRCRRGR